MAITKNVTSPTFVVEKRYRVPSKDCNLIHIDAYRLESDEDARSIGLDEIMSDNKDIVVVEWPEKIRHYWPDNAKKIYFEFIDENKRKISY